MNHKNIVLAIALAAASGLSQAAPLTWTLSGVTFVDLSTASGSFSYDEATQTYVSWSITTTQTVDRSLNGNTSLLGAAYTTNSLTNASSSHFQNASSFGVKNAAGNNFGLNFSHPLTAAGGSVALLSFAKGFEFAGFNSRNVTAGSVIATVQSPVPEPESYALLLAGLGFMGAALWQKKSNHNE